MEETEDSQGSTSPGLLRRTASRKIDRRRRDTSRTKKDIRVRAAAHPRAARKRALHDIQELIGPFRLLEPVPASNGKELFLAERVRPGAPTAKVLLELVRSESESYDADKETLLARAAMLSGGAHPSWVALIDAGEEEDGAYFAVEHVDGWTLEKLAGDLRKKHLALPLEVSSFIAVEILRGLHAAVMARHHHPQEVEIILRDLTPAHVLISKTGQVKLSHHAFVPALAGPSCVTVRAGDRTSYAYVAPELVEKAEFTSRSAIYSAGIIFHELLGGTVHPEANNHYQAVASVLERGVSARELAREGVPEALIEVVARATQPKAEERFSSAMEMADAIEAWLFASGRPLTPSMLEKFFRGDKSAIAARRIRGSSAVITAAATAGESTAKVPPPPPPDRKAPLQAINKTRKVRERRAPDVEARVEGVEVVLGEEEEFSPAFQRALSLAPVKFRARRRAERPQPPRVRPAPKKKSGRTLRLAVELLLLALLTACYATGVFAAI